MTNKRGTPAPVFTELQLFPLGEVPAVEVADHTRGAYADAGRLTPEQVALNGVQLDLITELALQDVPARKTSRNANRAAFARYVGPENFDVFNEHDFSTMPEADKRWINPAYLRSFLYPDKDVKSPNRVSNINVNPFEFRLIIRARDPIHIRNAAYNRVQGFDDPTDEVRGKAERGGIHTLEAKIEAMTQHRNNLGESEELLARLARRTRYPGLAHETDQNLRLLYANLWNEIENIMNVAQVAAGWTDEERDRADTSLLFYLTQGPSARRVKHFKEMISLATAYVRARKKLTGTRITAAAGFVAENPPPARIEEVELESV